MLTRLSVPLTVLFLLAVASQNGCAHASDGGDGVEPADRAESRRRRRSRRRIRRRRRPRGHVERALRTALPHARGPRRAGRPRRRLEPGGAPRRGGPLRRDRAARSRAGEAADPGHDLPHLLHDEADHERRRDDVGRARPDPALRPDLEAHPRARRHEGPAHAGFAARRRRPREARDDGPRPPDPHLGPRELAPGHRNSEGDRAGLCRRGSARIPDEPPPRRNGSPASPAFPSSISPARRFLYGVSTDVLGQLVAVVSGKPFEVFLREEIFEPLGMPDTAFFVPVEKHDRFAGELRPGTGWQARPRRLAARRAAT